MYIAIKHLMKKKQEVIADSHIISRTKGYSVAIQSNQRGHNIKSREHRPEQKQSLQIKLG